MQRTSSAALAAPAAPFAALPSRGQLRWVWALGSRKEDLRGELKIGEHPALSLKHARNEARTLLELVRQGTDPKVASGESRWDNIVATRQIVALRSFAALLDA